VYAHGAPATALSERVERVTWGVTPSALAQAGKLGWEAYLDQQLKPDLKIPLPAEVQAQVDALSLSRTTSADLFRQQAERSREIRKLPESERPQAIQANRKLGRDRYSETLRRLAWRAIYSPDQLQEVMTWFWLNHFSVYASKGNISTLFDDYEDRTIRPHALGKFSDLLRATAHSPAMLIYLDNSRNAAGQINENYARELMELHTLGVNGGYRQKDVQELARVLTGMTVTPSKTPPKIKSAHREDLVSDGLFLFNPARHDYGDKVILGQTIHGDGMREVDSVLDMLARQPATARFISGKLAQYFVADTPAPALVDRMSQAFLKHDGDIGATLRAMFEAPEFAASLAHGKFKDPTQYVYSAMRLAYDKMPPILNAQPVPSLIARLGEAPGARITPDGYPTRQTDWSASGQMTARFEIARNIAASRVSFYRLGDDPPPKLPAMPRLANAYGKASDTPFATLSPATQSAITQARTADDANTLLLSSPEFMRR